MLTGQAPLDVEFISLCLLGPFGTYSKNQRRIQAENVLIFPQSVGPEAAPVALFFKKCTIRCAIKGILSFRTISCFLGTKPSQLSAINQCKRYDIVHAIVGSQWLSVNNFASTNLYMPNPVLKQKCDLFDGEVCDSFTIQMSNAQYFDTCQRG